MDVGCGAQPFAVCCPPRPAISGSTPRTLSRTSGIRSRTSLAIPADGRWPVGSGDADLVLATETLEHVDRPDAFLAEAHRLLKPGGRLVLTVPFAARWHYIPHDYWRFTPASLRMLLEDAGFREVVVNGRGNETTVTCYKVMALLLPVVLPQNEEGSPKMPARPGMLAFPFVLALASIANVSLGRPAGDDCLGYTVFARRP